MLTARRFRLFILVASLGSLLALAGCVLNDEGENVFMGPGEPPVPCTASVLCRLQNPADTIGLSVAQKSALLSQIDSLNDSVVLALATIDFDSLGNDILHLNLLSDLQVTIDSSRFVTLGILLPDSATGRNWRGYVKTPQVGFVDVTFHDSTLQGGFAYFYFTGQYITLYPLGGNKALVADDPSVIWMGECPGMKPGATSLTCIDPLP
jgi:hypothetical protein